MASGYSLSPVIIAYEPVWAISTEKNAQPDTPENALQIIKFIKKAIGHLPLTIKLIYGGSVDAVNAEGFLKYNEIEGALVGGASLKADEMGKIIAIAKKI